MQIKNRKIGQTNMGITSQSSVPSVDVRANQRIDTKTQLLPKPTQTDNIQVKYILKLDPYSPMYKIYSGSNLQEAIESAREATSKIKNAKIYVFVDGVAKYEMDTGEELWEVIVTKDMAKYGKVYKEVSMTYKGYSQVQASLAESIALKGVMTHTVVMVRKNNAFYSQKVANPALPLQLGTSVIEDQGFWETHKSKFYIGGGVLMLLGVGFYGWKTLKSK